MLKRFLKMFILTLLMTSAAFAQPAGKGLGGRGKSQAAKQAKVKATPQREIRGRFSCVNRRGQAVVFQGNSSDIPPGLRCRVMQSGLQKKSERPSGWGKGEKRGLVA
ncbi:hypothetical protein CbuD7D7780_05690 [Coxiella burnetii]|uniref:Uncharacterized protein n=1 Tax=Coxiella burnetii (strain Dugway 5J108-111) TaxID=434922 RepID=B5XHC4_COXBN|nr:hypothetical protein [Coxiella burnetii]ACI23144.1 hypothetical protein CBUD_1102b [Coxiella burnetii Dugway 5J108-111]OYK80251.1 hypothetical protein CbuD7E6568_05665 [Coxiella burnetii]OYK82334.1 hypothetical protein CbuD7D7780_05690 [Coxiella burnetii]